MKPGAAITARKRITENVTAKALMASFTWKAISIAPAAIIAARAVVIVGINVCIARIILYGLGKAKGFAFFGFYDDLGLRVCC